MIRDIGINRVFLIGIVENEPQWHTINSKKKFLSCLLSTKELKDEHSLTSHTKYHEIRIPFQKFNLEEGSLQKGQLISVTGKIQNRQIIDEQERKRCITEIFVRQIAILKNEQEN
jgi:single-stranded DNA-binding protein